jgi:hypothetical protein
MIITTNLPNINDNDSINSPSSPSEYENKIMPKKKRNSIDEYIEHIEKQCEKSIKPTKKIEKVCDETLSMPIFSQYLSIIDKNYNVQQLKTITKHYKLKLSGNKNQLINRLFVFLKLSYSIVKIQKVFRGRLQRNYNKYHGPAFLKRELCTNRSDFLSIEEMSDLSYSQFFSYKDADGFIYGFDIISLYNLILKSGKSVKNPYNRNVIPQEVIHNIRNLIRLSKVLKIQIDIDIKDITPDISPQKSIELRILDVFQNIDSLGNYSDSNWFLSLNINQILRFVRELHDIWDYRAQLTQEIKRKICPPNGDPFRVIHVSHIMNEPNINNVRSIVCSLLEKLVNTGIDNDSKSLGAYYVLGALTLVNSTAATALPWLFQSVSHFQS